MTASRIDHNSLKKTLAETEPSTHDNVWLTGLPESVDIITVGQKVEPVIINSSQLGPVGLMPSRASDQTQLVQRQGAQQ